MWEYPSKPIKTFRSLTQKYKLSFSNNLLRVSLFTSNKLQYRIIQFLLYYLSRQTVSVKI